MVSRRSRLVSQAIQSFFFVPFQPLVPGFPAHPVPPAQLRHAQVVFFVVFDELEAFFHGTCLFPPHTSCWTRRLGLKVSPMCPDRTVTHVPGPYTSVGRPIVAA